jgi:hypothetical protein
MFQKNVRFFNKEKKMSATAITESTGTGTAIGSVVPGVGTAIGATIGTIVGGLSSVIGTTKEGISEQAKQINNEMVQYIIQYDNMQNKLFPNSVNVDQSVKDFQSVQGISALTLWMSQWQASDMFKKVSPNMPLEWYQGVNKALQTLPKVPVPAGVVYSDNYVSGVVANTPQTGGSVNYTTGQLVNPIKGTINSITDSVNKTTGTNLSSTNIILILGLVGALTYMFFKGKK